MMKFILHLPLLLITFCTTTCLGQNSKVINLMDAVRNNHLEVKNRALTLLDDGTYPGIRLSKEYGEGLAILKGVQFSEGTIEFDVRGEDIKQHSFVGIAFHGQNDSTYEAIYLRPFHFRTQDSVLRERMIQYISLPMYTWQKLRSTFPMEFENAIDTPPAPDSWVHMRIEVADSTISTYINNNKAPNLVVKKMSSAKKGWVGFYVADTSGGDFANLIIRKK